MPICITYSMKNRRVRSAIVQLIERIYQIIHETFYELQYGKSMAFMLETLMKGWWSRKESCSHQTESKNLILDMLSLHLISTYVLRVTCNKPFIPLDGHSQAIHSMWIIILL